MPTQGVAVWIFDGVPFCATQSKDLLTALFSGRLGSSTVCLKPDNWCFKVASVAQRWAECGGASRSVVNNAASGTRVSGICLLSRVQASVLPTVTGRREAGGSPVDLLQICMHPVIHSLLLPSMPMTQSLRKQGLELNVWMNAQCQRPVEKYFRSVFIPQVSVSIVFYFKDVACLKSHKHTPPHIWRRGMFD